MIMATLKKGSSGSDVTRLQERLKERGFDPGNMVSNDVIPYLIFKDGFCHSNSTVFLSPLIKYEKYFKDYRFQKIQSLSW